MNFLGKKKSSTKIPKGKQTLPKEKKKILVTFSIEVTKLILVYQ